MLIRNAGIHGVGAGDLRCEGGKIAAIGVLEPRPGETVLDARGGALLPGLHDHHIHLAGLAARRNSVPCGPPDVVDAGGLAAALSVPGEGWLRGVDFHESVLGRLPDAATLDRIVSHRPLRMQHSTGRMWFFNSMALEILLSNAEPSPGLEREGGRFTGRLFDDDPWLRRTLAGTPPDLADTSRELARFGVTGITDMSPRNDTVMAEHFGRQRRERKLRQNLILAGTLSLIEAPPRLWLLGPAKLHLHEAALPAFDDALAFIRSAHAQGRGVAVHCVSELELVFTLALFEAAGTIRGDRIEHASVASLELTQRMAALHLQVCVQPHFIAERGDRYLAEVEPRHQADLYRLRTLAKAGLPLAGGSDAPYGTADPWQAMAAAVSRRTASRAVIGGGEALTPEEALALYLADPLDLTRQRAIVVGEPADLCLLDRPWARARECLSSANVAATLIAGS
ncbi:amidohydrolase [Novosphingobium endophyticum]|uniref:Amidohydrolase n=1 Tax=Novosphingobium endophyticum TaxID=1955250 RepID=A0A916X492_9SPHN|nr:amidohydrolase family protein [Novosphingobium endophyticum]GGB99094.1 amidohydrolase [Novosphingobium endophyticum]